MSLQYRKKSSSPNEAEQLNLYNSMIKEILAKNTNEKWKSEIIYHALDKIRREFEESELEANNIFEDTFTDQYFVLTYGISIFLITSIISYYIFWS